MKNNVHRGAIFYANLKADGTSRQSGVRPVVICSNELANKNSPIISVISLTTRKTKHRIPTHIYINAIDTGLKFDSIALCEQPLSIAKTDLREYVCTLDDSYMQKISNGLRVQLAL